MLWDFINCCYHQIFAGHVVNAVAPEDSFTYLEKLRTGPGEDRMAWNISFISSGTIDGLLIRFSFYGIYDICLLIEWTCGYVLALDSSCSCSLACCCNHLLMKHSSTALLIFQCSKFSHETLATLWLLVSFQRWADVEVKLGLGRKRIPGKLSKHCIF